MPTPGPTDLPRKAISRTAKLASLPLGAAGRATIGLGRRIGGAPAEQVMAEFQRRTADQMFSVLGELKGGAMKFGQMLSLMETAMPEEFAAPYRATLTKLQDSAPPMPASTVHTILSTELGARWRDRFREFDDIPAAAASIGQVHQGVLKDGRVVAIKLLQSRTAAASARFLREATITSRLQHPSIVTVLDVVRWTDGTPAYSMPLYPGPVSYTHLTLPTRCVPTCGRSAGSRGRSARGCRGWT